MYKLTIEPPPAERRSALMVERAAKGIMPPARFERHALVSRPTKLEPDNSAIDVPFRSRLIADHGSVSPPLHEERFHAPVRVGLLILLALGSWAIVIIPLWWLFFRID